MAGRLYLICEHNEALSRPLLWDSIRLSLGLTQAITCRDFASVWAAAVPLDPEGEDLSRMATKLLGPLPLSRVFRAPGRTTPGGTPCGTDRGTPPARDQSPLKR
jgi:hypothetical protein